MNAKFEVGKKYQTRSVYDSDCTFELKVIGRSEKFVKIESLLWKKSCKIHTDDDGNEWISPDNYRGAPIFRAYREVA